MEDLRTKLFEIMRKDFGVMAEHGDNEADLLDELNTAGAEILNTYADIFLN